MIHLKGVRKVYDGRVIISILDSQLGQKIYWLKGQNGTGKSTLLKLIAGMIPFEGDVEVDGVSLRKHPIAYRRLVSYIEAEPAYPPFLTATDLIGFYQATRGAKKEQVEQLQELFGVAQFMKSPIRTCSSGMIKKISLVLAFMGEPRLILLDEPLVTIDKETVPLLCKMIGQRSAGGVSFIIASHQELHELILPPVSELNISTWAQ